MADPYEFRPPFVSPLTHDQHARVGRIALLWGQIDMELDQLLMIALNLPGRQLRTLMGEKAIGRKLEMLENHLDDLKSSEARKCAREFWNLTNQTKTLRNRCFHGIWGFACSRDKKVIAAAGHFKALNDPLRASQLPALEKKLCKTARVGLLALRAAGMPFTDGHNRLFHGTGKPPAWLQEWTNNIYRMIVLSVVTGNKASCPISSDLCNHYGYLTPKCRHGSALRGAGRPSFLPSGRCFPFAPQSVHLRWGKKPLSYSPHLRA
jgi:hypothetical protein